MLERINESIAFYEVLDKRAHKENNALNIQYYDGILIGLKIARDYAVYGKTELI